MRFGELRLKVDIARRREGYRPIRSERDDITRRREGYRTIRPERDDIARRRGGYRTIRSERDDLSQRETRPERKTYAEILQGKEKLSVSDQQRGNQYGQEETTKSSILELKADDE
ncbi:hypothetical protein Ancab_018808, partial [Ancistrocladus abbreviatus]